MSKPRVLVLAEAANPKMVSVPLVGWSHAQALAGVADTHLVTQVRNREALLEAGLSEGVDFTAIDSEKVARPVRSFAQKLRGGSGKGWTTIMAMNALIYPYFERLVWKTFGERIRQGEFDVVHRVTPVSPTLPSSMAKRCKRVGVPFVIGPLNGGVPWPKQFDQARRREREWLSYCRGVYRWLPGYRSTCRNASAIVAGSSDTLAQLPESCRDRCVYLPENAIDPDRFPTPNRSQPGKPLKVVFVGRLVPYKGADMLVEALAPLVKDGRLVIDIIGDGPQRQAIEALIEQEQIGSGVTLAGWVPHEQLSGRLSEADVLGFPSIREFGGGVVLEAMALGVVPVIVDYGGPGELLTPQTGVAVPMASRDAIVSSMREAFTELCDQPEKISEMSRSGVQRVQSLFTWPRKAEQMLEVYRWVTGQRDEKPDFGQPLSDTPTRGIAA